jgi:transcription antitermination factor NusG
MKKNWYAVHTKTQCERKAALFLSKKRIQCFCPLNNIVIRSGNKKKILQEPLFPSFVFVFISEAELPIVRQANDVINFIYWLGKPAVIKAAEIENINLFVNSYYDIKLEKTAVNPNGVVHIANEEDNLLNHRGGSPVITKVRASLPSLGYVMHAMTKNEITESSKYDVVTNVMI